MKSDKKKIVSVLLGFMASISSTSAMKDGSINESTKNTSTEMVSVSTKRHKGGPGLGRDLMELILTAFASNEVSSNLPIVKKFTYPILRPWLSDYRVRRNVRGEFIRSDGPTATGYGYTIFNESDHNYYQLAFMRNCSLYTQNNVLKKDVLKKIDVNDIKNIKRERNLLIVKLYSFNVINLAMEDENGNILSGADSTNIRKFLELNDYTASDAADALSKVLEFVNVINSDKSDEDKVNLIDKQFDVTCVARSKKDVNSTFRIFVKECKNAKGETRRIFAEFRLQDEKTKNEIEKEDADKLKKEMEDQKNK